ncbi:hypothetical protein Van01_43240 [Micromonospora andamanensis]|uniref:DUF397 domain-containing protein n=1 Tax=Micromonospora andamanensis TaxID=1287068 RepID=A0ABQ4HZL7_9ACTN|nr:hypothetical protein Van01_43240 [Micromonospora andamanensis]
MVLTGATWRASTRSGSTDRVEAADNLPGVVAVRDSKDRQGPMLAFTPSTWPSSVDKVKRALSAAPAGTEPPTPSARQRARTTA